MLSSKIPKDELCCSNDLVEAFTGGMLDPALDITFWNQCWVGLLKRNLRQH
jgi:hypothetical protein